MRINKVFYGIMVAILFIVLGYHYKLNYTLAKQPPSEKWAKEVLMAEGNIKGFPSITEYKGKNIIAFNEGNQIKIISTDKLGNILKEAVLGEDVEIPQNINMLINEEKLNLCYFASGKDGGDLKIITLDDNLGTIESNTISGVIGYIKINDNTLGMVYNEKIDVMYLDKNQVITVKTGEGNFLATSVKYEDKDYIIYSNNFGELSYFFLENGVPSEIKPGGAMNQFSRVKFTNITSIIDKDVVTNLIEYVYKSDYIGYKYISFSLKTGEVIGNGEFPIKYEGAKKGYISSGEGITIATLAPYKDEEGKLLISAPRTIAKGKSQTDIVEMNLENKLGVMGEAVSRTTSVSINPAIYKDTLVFIDPIKEGHAKLYITSTRDDFKELNNKGRFNEKSEAFLQTFEALVFSFAYVITYGMIWIIPSISVFSILSLLEYRFSYNTRKIIFVSAYIITTIFKILVVKGLSFNRFKGFLPAHFTFPIGVAAMITISLICLIYGYINYKDDLEKNVMALSYSKPIFIDSFLTLVLFVGFLK